MSWLSSFFGSSPPQSAGPTSIVSLPPVYPTNPSGPPQDMTTETLNPVKDAEDDVKDTKKTENWASVVLDQSPYKYWSFLYGFASKEEKTTKKSNPESRSRIDVVTRERVNQNSLTLWILVNDQVFEGMITKDDEKALTQERALILECTSLGEYRLLFDKSSSALPLKLASPIETGWIVGVILARRMEKLKHCCGEEGCVESHCCVDEGCISYEEEE